MPRTRILSAVALCLVIVPLIALSACNDPNLGQTKQPWAHTDTYMVDQGSVLTVPAATGVLDNDEGKGLRCDAGTITTNQGGTVILVGDGGFTYTPLGLFAGVDVFAYKVRNDGGYDIGSVQITVNPVLPFAIDDSYATTLNTALNVPAASGVLFNDTLNGATITAPAFAPTVANTTQGGSLLLNADGSFDYTPLAAFTGNDTFTYTLTNPQGTDNGTVTIAVRQAPTAVADAGYMMSPGATLTVPVGASSLFANDTLGFPAATLTSFGGGSAGGTVTTNTAGNTLVLGTGSLTVNANGSFTFTPDTGFGGNFTFNYRLTNAAGTSDALVTINVDPAPFAVNDPSLTATSTVLLSVAAPGLMSNDALGVPAATIVSFGGGSMGGTVTSNVAGTPVALGTGSITVNANGSLSFTSNTGFTGNFTFDYRLTNIAGSSDATVTIFVQLGPTAVADSYTTAINTPFSRATTDADDLLDNDMGVPSPTIASFGGGSAGGTVTSNLAGATATFGAGSLTVNANGSFTFTPDTGFIGNFTFQYRAQNAVATSDATVTIAVTQAPTAVPDPSYIATSTVALIVPVGSGLLVNNGLGFPAATVVNFGAGDLGGLVTDNVAGATVPLGTGSLIVRADGSFDFTSNTGFRGNFTFQYRIQNSIGFSDAAVTIEVRLAPGAVADTYNTPPGVPLSVSAGTGVLSNDERGFPLANVTSFGGGSLGGTVTSNAAGTTITPLPSFSDGSITLNADGSISFTPATGQLGAFTFSYRITNLQGTSDAGVTISVNQAPVAVNDGTYTTPVNTTLTVLTSAANDLLDNDTLGTPVATLTSFGGGSLGGAVTDNAAGSGAAMAGGTITVNADGSFSLTTPTIIGAYTFMYRLTNTAGTSDGIVTLEVRQAPVANDDGTYTMLVNTTLSIATSAANDLLDNDTRGFPLATIASFGGGSLGGTVTSNTAGTGAALAGGTLTINADGSFSFANPTSTGNFTFQYRLTNAAGSDDATVTLDVRQIPVANDDNPGALYMLTLGGNLSRPAGDLFANDTLGFPAATIVSFGPSTGLETAAGSPGSTSGGAGLTVNANGSFSFTPVANGVHTFVYRLLNAAGSDTAIVTITVNQPPTANDDNPGATYTLTLGGNLSRPAGDLFVNNGAGADIRGFPVANIASFGPVTGVETTAGSAGSSSGGTGLTVNADGSFSYTPVATGMHTFVYTLTNTQGSDTAIVTITVNQPPTANDDNPGALYSVTLSGTLSRPAGDLYVDHGAGADVLGFPTATIVSFGPSAGNETVAGNAGSTSGGSGLTVNANGSFSYTPVANGTHTFIYRLQNAAGFDTAIVTITVNQAPTAVADPTGGIPGTSSPGSTPFHIAMNGSIVSGTSPVLISNDTLGFPTATVSSFGPATGLETTVASASNGTSAAGGTVRVFANGTFNYSPINATFTGLDSFRYTLTNAGGSSTAIVSLAIGIRPAAANENYSTSNGNLIGNVSINTAASTNFSVLTNDTGNQIVAALVSATNGTATVNANGTFTFNPTPGFEGGATITYSVSNGFGAAAANGVVTMTVAGMLWFVDNNAGSNLDGRLGTPFNSLANFNAGAADDPVDNIFLFRQTAAAYTGGITLLNNQRLIGQGAATSIVGITGLTLPADSPALPATGGTNPIVNGGITLGSGNTLNGLNSGDGTTTGLISGTNFGTLTIATVSVNSNVGALNLVTGTVSGTFTSVTSAGGVSGVLLGTINGTWTVSAGSITGATGAAFSITGASGMSLTFNANIAGGTGGQTVNISGGTSSVTFGGNVTQTNNQPLLIIQLVHTTGTITFQTGTVSATNGNGLQFDEANGTYNFNGTTTLNGGDAGIDIFRSTGTFGFGTGVALTHNAAGTGFNLGGGTPSNSNVTYSGSISDNSGFAIDIDNHDAGTITFQTGSLSAIGTGIRVRNCNGGTVNFNQPTKSISTGTGTAVDMQNNAGGTVNFGNGGLQITTTSGTGFLAASSGTVTVSTGLANNTISSTTGTALNIANTTIGANGVTFFSINANGGTNGIVLNTTGNLGGLTVTGTGSTAGSGGTIQNITTRGASFITAVNVTLRNMNFTNACTADFPAGPTGLSTGVNIADNAALHFQYVTNVVLDNLNISGSAEQGINGHFVTNFVLRNSSMANCGGGPDEDGIHFFNMLGACQITNTSVTSSGDDNFNIQNNTNLAFPSGMTAVGDIAFSGGSANTGVLGSGYLFGIRGTSVCSIALSGVTSDNNFSGGIVADCFDTATMCLDVGSSTSTNNNDAISLSCANGNVNFDIHDNVSFAGTDFGVINMLKAAFSTTGSLEGRVHNNPIVVADGRPADGLFVFQAGAGAIRVAVTNNTFAYRGTQRAMVFQAGQDGGGSIQATVTGNNIDMQLDGTGNAVAGVLAQAAITSPTGDGASINLDFGGAGALRNVFTHSLGGTMAGGDIRVRQRLNGTYNLSGYGGAATDTAAVIAYLTARNTVVSPPTATADSVGFTGTTTPAFVSVSVSPTTSVENSGVNLVFTLTRTGSTAAGLVVNFSVYGIASFSGSVDFSVSGGGITFNTGTGSGTATFGAGNATITITVTISFDATVEPNEAMIIDVSGGSSGRGVILNDD